MLSQKGRHWDGSEQRLQTTLATVHPFSSSAQAQAQQADIKFTCTHVLWYTGCPGCHYPNTPFLTHLKMTSIRSCKSTWKLP